MNKDKARACQVCGDSLSKGSIVYCSFCNTPHHEDCWAYTRQCSTFGCGCRKCQETPREDDPSASGKNSPENLMTIDSSGDGWLSGERVRLSIKPSQRLINLGTDRHSNTGEFSNSYSRLDIDTFLEKFVSTSAACLLASGIALAFLQKSSPSMIFTEFCVFMSAILMFFRMFIDCTYVLDNRARLLLYSRSIFGWTSTWKICEFSEIVRVGIMSTRIESNENCDFLYSVVLELPTHTSIAVSEPESDFDKVDGYATLMATHLDTELLVSVEEIGSLQEEGYDIPMIPWKADWRSWPVFGRPGFLQVMFFIVTLIASLVLLFR